MNINKENKILRQNNDSKVVIIMNLKIRMEKQILT